MKSCVPHYYTSKRNTIIHVLISTAFAELFILIFEPFQSRKLVDSDWQFLLWATVVVLVAMGVIAISRTLMYYYCKKHRLNYVEYGIWILAEVSAMALIYTLFPLLAWPQLCADHYLTFFMLFKEAILKTFFILLIPYFTLTLWFELEESIGQVRRLKDGVVNQNEAQPGMYNFSDENGDLKLSVKPEMVYYIEAADNYIQVHYTLNDKLQSELIRNKLRNIADQFQGQDLVRCSRSYVVNLSKVKVIKRVGKKLLLDFGNDKIQNIPVGKLYSDEVIKHFTQNIGEE